MNMQTFSTWIKTSAKTKLPKTTLRKLYHLYNYFKPDQVQANYKLVPGMTTQAERDFLYRTAVDIASREPHGALIDFGAFMGASSAALAEALKNTPNTSENLKVHVVDIFSCPENSEFAPHVLKHTMHEHQNLLVRENGALKWEKVYRTHMIPYSNHLITHVKMASDFTWTDEPVHLCHVDLPKRLEDVQKTLYKVLPCMPVGSIIIFQDYFYEWSASLIAFVALLTQQNYVDDIQFRATSLSCKISKPITKSDLVDFNSKLTNIGIENLLKWAVSYERSTTYVLHSRIHIALIQWLYKQQKYDQASQLYRDSITSLNPKQLDDFHKSFAAIMALGFTHKDLES